MVVTEIDTEGHIYPIASENRRTEGRRSRAPRWRAAGGWNPCCLVAGASRRFNEVQDVREAAGLGAGGDVGEEAARI